MTTRDSLLTAIQERPRDLALRLIFADWLEEHGDADDQEHASFIRLQHRLEPRRMAFRDAELQALLEEEEQLLALGQEKWAAQPLFDSPDQPSDLADFRFRRGFLEEATLTANDYLAVAEQLASYPAFHHLRLVHVEGWSARLAETPGMEVVRELTFFPGPFDSHEEVLSLARSPYLRNVDTLHLWQFTPVVAEDYLGLVQLPTLERVVLHQLEGSVPGDERERATREMEAFAERVRSLGDLEVSVVRPWDRLFPLCGDVWDDLYAGHTGDGRPTLMIAGRTTQFLHFDDQGHLIETIIHDLDAYLTRRPEYGWRRYNEAELLQVVKQRFGFTLGVIHVRELIRDDLSIYLPYSGEEDLESLLYWIEGANFQIELDGGDPWSADLTGKVHTT